MLRMPPAVLIKDRAGAQRIEWERAGADFLNLIPRGDLAPMQWLTIFAPPHRSPLPIQFSGVGNAGDRWLS
jgi:hypothetical protein